MNVFDEQGESANLGQEELDKLLSGAFPEGGEGAGEGVDGHANADNGGGSLSQADLDALFGGDETGDEPAPDMAEAAVDPAAQGLAEESGSLSQADLDALFGGDETGDEPAPDMAEAAVDPSPRGLVEESGSLSQADLNELFDGAGGGTEEANDLPDSDCSEAVDSASDEDQMDRLIADLIGDPVEDGASGEKALDTKGDNPEPGDDAMGPGTDTERGAAQADTEDEDDFVGLDDDEMEMGGYEADQADSQSMAPESQDLPTGAMMVDAVEIETNPAETPVTEKVSARIASTPSAGRLKAVIIAGVVLLLLMGGIGGGVVYRKWQVVTTATKTEPKTPVAGQAAPEKVPADQQATANTETTVPTEPLPAGVQKGLADLDTLRQQMVAKKEEIDALKNEYLAKNRQAEGRILAEAERRGITTLKEALAVRQIELALKTVQRRMAYVQKLDEPAARLREGSETLLFVKRLTEIDGHLADVSNGLDAGVLEKRLLQAMDRCRIEPVDLVVDIQTAHYPDMEAVWKPISVGLKKGSSEPAPGSPVQVAEKKAGVPASPLDNAQILKEIVAGNFEHVFYLTHLTPEAARSLAGWSHRDLFLNDLSHLSSQEAAYLAQWAGTWMALNGLKTISVDVARHLMHWQGERLSLNGIEEVGADAARYLAQWPGAQIELVGLRRLSPTAAKLLSKWQKNGGRVFVPERFKRRKTSPAGRDKPAVTKKD